MIKGSIVALVTPMFEDGSIDYDSYRNLIEMHIAAGTNAIVAVGTTGESPTVDFPEHNELIRVAVEAAAGRIPIIAGTGSNSTREAIELTEYAASVGAAASLQVVPYYNKPTQEGLYQHFKTIAEAVDLPMILYNVPGRTVADLKNDTILRLVEVPGIIGVKDATGDLARAADLMSRLAKDKEFAIYSGNDDSALALMLMGGSGVISVTANVAPRLMSEMCELALQNDVMGARAINDRLMALHKELFCEPNPVAPKWALQRMGLIPGGIRLPLVPLSPSKREQVERALQIGGCI
ncbi:4-hydroxy-tetrahydrodipicolinate synthase [Parasutterella muris]|uniref:4-hydroxy-tetrahydrodipicolinate synthase n=1 Tax=Parasutterella muris TaxID=2565572 RepID=A0A6L6YIX4_9BURK|nr:4-hydroxy-tetrahydrodipicolinate synthase [Parasutterella muris]MVX56699.1 4-hydroxy-tetrahydrodipicolinate synthase [Parasutterella muris]